MLAGSTGADLAVDGTGRVYLATDEAVRARRPGQEWRRIAVPRGDWWSASIAAAGRGRAVVVFTGPGRGQPDWEQAARVRRPRGGWTRARFFPSTTNNPWIHAAISRGGSAFVSASRFYDPDDARVARFTPGGGWTPMVNIADGSQGRVLCGPGGNALLFFRSVSDRLHASYRPVP
jgi:hypothetical protein